MSDTEIAALFDEWNSALQTGDPGQVAALYAPNAILLPTLSNQVCHNHEEIKDYFAHFLHKEPKGFIDESNIRSFDQLAINAGIYTFSFKDGTSVQARFTFVYWWNGERWLITEHHSSEMPEQPEY